MFLLTKNRIKWLWKRRRIVTPILLAAGRLVWRFRRQTLKAGKKYAAHSVKHSSFMKRHSSLRPRRA